MTICEMQKKSELAEKEMQTEYAQNFKKYVHVHSIIIVFGLAILYIAYDHYVLMYLYIHVHACIMCKQH